MKKFIPYLLFSVTTLHTVLANSPVMAMGCGLHSNKAVVTCEKGDIECKEEVADEVVN